MKTIKLLIVLLLTASMLFSLAACGSKNGSDGKTDPNEQSENTDGKGEPEHNPDRESDSGKSDKDTTPDKDSDQKKETEPEKEPEPDKESEEDPENEPETEPEEESEPEKEDTDPAPDLSGDYSGSFSSATGTSLDLIVRWAAERESDGSYTVTLAYYIDSYSLEAGGRDSNKLTVTTSSGTSEYYFSSDDIEKNTDEKAETYIGGSSLRLSAEELAAGADASVSWDFRGSYTGVELPTVTASGVIGAY